ncbi:MAG: response regulator transcription factor [Deltaproteobacteria bacterium]|nr:response regulator transcription factor [Deltaproteobacteria bacterium]
MEKPKAKILVVEDDPPILKGLLDVLIFNGFAPTGVADGGEGLEQALNHSYDLILLDIMLPTLDGISICRRVRKQKQDQAVVMITAKGSEDDIIEGFKAGADDYINKPFSLRELMVRIEAVLRRTGKTSACETIILNNIAFDSGSLIATCGNKKTELTRRELDIVFYLHRNRERIVSKKELLKEVWQYSDTNIETRTVDIHIQKLRKKIADLASGAVMIVTVRGEGYRIEEQV